MSSHRMCPGYFTKTEFTRCRYSTVNNLVQSLQEYNAKEMYLHLKSCLVSFESIENVPWSSVLSGDTMPFSKCAGQSSVFETLMFRICHFQNLLAKNCSLCKREAYPSHFCRFQNLAASCERSVRGEKSVATISVIEALAENCFIFLTPNI